MTVKTSRYRELLGALVLVAVGAWWFAEPGGEVTLPNAALTRHLPPIAWDKLSLRLEPILPPRSFRQALETPEEFLRDWEDVDPTQFYLNLTVTPGSSLQTTTFEVVYKGPPEYIAPTIYLRDADQGGLMELDTMPRGPGHWKFQGSDLRPYPRPPANPHSYPTKYDVSLWPKSAVLRPGRWLVVADVLDPNNEPYSRRVNTLTLESATVELK